MRRTNFTWWWQSTRLWPLTSRCNYLSEPRTLAIFEASKHSFRAVQPSSPRLLPEKDSKIFFSAFTPVVNTSDNKENMQQQHKAKHFDWVQLIPFKSSFSNWFLPLMALATVRAACAVSSPKDRLSSWQAVEKISSYRKKVCLLCNFSGKSVELLLFLLCADAFESHLEDGESFRHGLSDGLGPVGPQETVAKVDHLDAVQVFQRLKDTQAVDFSDVDSRNELQICFLLFCRTICIYMQNRTTHTHAHV